MRPNLNSRFATEAEYICDYCGKVSYRHCSIAYKENFEGICPQYERRIK